MSLKNNIKYTCSMIIVNPIILRLRILRFALLTTQI